MMFDPDRQLVTEQTLSDLIDGMARLLKEAKAALCALEYEALAGPGSDDLDHGNETASPLPRGEPGPL